MKTYILSFITFLSFSFATTFTVSIVNSAFVPDSSTIVVGDIVIWTNNGNFHNVTGENGAWGSNSLINGETFTHQFDVVGPFPYQCTFHGGMNGSITVVEELAIENSSAYLKSFRLNPIYPNPFNPSTTISWEQDIPSQITLNIYNIKGLLIDAFEFGMLSAGSHQIQWQPENLTSGIYLVKMVGDEFSLTQKVVYSK